MTAKKASWTWTNVNDTTIVEEMLRDLQSEHWDKCREFVKSCVQRQARNIPTDYCDDIVQEAMIRVSKYLSTFRYQCKLRTWLLGIISSCIIDFHRKFIRIERCTVPLTTSFHDSEYEVEMRATTLTDTVEDEYITYDELEKALAALQEYLSLHAHASRNKQILNMVLLEGRSLKVTADTVGCSAPVAGYVVRSAQQYVREKLGYQRQTA